MGMGMGMDRGAAAPSMHQQQHQQQQQQQQVDPEMAAALQEARESQCKVRWGDGTQGHKGVVWVRSTYMATAVVGEALAVVVCGDLMGSTRMP